MKARSARLFLSFLPSNAHQNMKIESRLIPRASKESSTLYLKLKDGKELNLDPEALGLEGIFEEVDRHSRILARKEELNG